MQKKLTRWRRLLQAFDTVPRVGDGCYLAFAQAAWPEASTAVTAARRAGYRRTAGALLAKMEREGLVRGGLDGFVLTDAGRAARAALPMSTQGGATAPRSKNE